MIISAEKLETASSKTAYTDTNSTLPSVQPAYLDRDIGSGKADLDFKSTPIKREVLQTSYSFPISEVDLVRTHLFRMLSCLTVYFAPPILIDAFKQSGRRSAVKRP
jgi:hypothetical protein